MDRLRCILFWLIISLTALFLLIPTIIIVPMSFTTTTTLEFPPVGFTLAWYGKVLGSSDWQSALINSLSVAASAAILATILGTAASLALHAASFRGKTFLIGLLLTPMVTPV